MSLFKKIGLFGSCQLHLCSNFFLSEAVKSKNNYEIIFSLPFYEHDEKYGEFKGDVDYNLFNELDILIIENNNLQNSASSDKIIKYCLEINPNIKIIKTFLVKFPIYPLNWSGYGEKKSDYLEWMDLEKIDFKKKFNKCILSLIEENKKSDLSLDITKFIENNFNKKLLFTHSLHPTNYLLYEIWKSIFDNLNININEYNYDLKQNELIYCWFNPFTTKMMKDLDIQFEVLIDDNFYINRYSENKELINQDYKGNYIP